MDLAPGSVPGMGLLKSLDFPVMRVIKVSLFMLMKDFWKAPKDRDGCQEKQPCDQKVRLSSPTPLTSQEGRGARG